VSFFFFLSFKMVMPIMEIAAIMMRIVMISVSGGVGVWGFWFGGICSVVVGVAA
jgi:hypothetical protein